MKLSLIRKLSNKLCSISVSLRSSVLSEYFYTLMTNNNIKSTRNGMQVLIFYSYCEIVSSHMSERGTIFRPILAFISFVIYFLFYATTISVKKPLVLVRLSSIMVVLCMLYTVVLGTDIKEISETHYSLTLVVVLMIYTLFRLRFLITILLSIIYILIFVSIGNFRIKYITHMTLNYTEYSPLDRKRLHKFNMPHKHAFITGQVILFTSVLMVGVYLRILNSVRRKSAFLKLAQNAEDRMKIYSAQMVQNYWIEAIMPTSVKENFQKKIKNQNMNNLVYCQAFEDVTILFGDIVGFTAMSSNKTAFELVSLLNDLYHRFDEYGKFTNCEKLGTLGDCYYCVAGCPVPQSDHGFSCVEMGLGMCKLIQRFNKDHKEDVNMRVGVHSGRVIAAIIGIHRFRFDVFSNDVIIASTMESSGKAGRVHISEDTYRLVSSAFVVERGDDIDVKKEEMFGISGMMQKTVPMKTYFIVPAKHASSKLISSLDTKSITKTNVLQQLETKEDDTDLDITIDSNKNNFNNGLKDRYKTYYDPYNSISAETLKLYQYNKSNKRVSTTMTKEINEDQQFDKKDEKIKEDLALIRTLQQDPEKPVQFFQHPPLHPVLLLFTDKEIEYHYLFHTTDQVEKISIVSSKIALLLDCVACLLFTTLIYLASLLMIPNITIFNLGSQITYFTGFICALVCGFISLMYKSEIKNRWTRGVYCLFSHPLLRLVLSMYISSLPGIYVISIYDSKLMHHDYMYTTSYMSLTLFSLIGNCILTSSSSLAKLCFTLVFAIVPIALINGHFGSAKTSIYAYHNCSMYLEYVEEYKEKRLRLNFTFQLLHICLLIYFLTRENEKNLRIYFYAAREAGIRNAEAIRAKKIAENLLYNIIPKYVFNKIVNVTKSVNEVTFSYAHGIKNAGVVFACISDFFAKYYREDYRGGEVALKVLHTIICIFDNLLHKQQYKDYLEKIKTINDCYMLASGLHMNDKHSTMEDHLIALMNYAFEMRYQLNLFNEQNIIGQYVFTLKIGYNFGPITAGIIGTTKPLYDIWGDTVNVASRMYSTATPGIIQVPDYVSTTLRNNFEFQLRGIVPIKGKGNMVTYTAIQSYDKPHLTFPFISKKNRLFARSSSALT